MLRHHRGYVGGISAWWPNWKTQMVEAYSLAGSRWILAIVWLIAWLASGFASNGPRLFPAWDRRRILGGLLVLGLGSFVFAFQANLPWWVGLGWCPWLLLAPRPSVRLVGTWWLLLSILTPFYHPYARLWLPLHAVGWLMLGGMIARSIPFRRAETAGSPASRASEDRLGPGRRSVRWGVSMACLLVSALPLARAIPAPIPWQRVLTPDPSRSMRAFVFDYLPGVEPLRGKTSTSPGTSSPGVLPVRASTFCLPARAGTRPPLVSRRSRIVGDRRRGDSLPGG